MGSFLFQIHWMMRLCSRLTDASERLNQNGQRPSGQRVLTGGLVSFLWWASRCCRRWSARILWVWRGEFWGVKMCMWARVGWAMRRKLYRQMGVCCSRFTGTRMGDQMYGRCRCVRHWTGTIHPMRRCAYCPARMLDPARKSKKNCDISKLRPGSTMRCPSCFSPRIPVRWK